MKAKCIYIPLLLLMFLASCSVKSKKGELPPWGDSANDSTALSLSDIIANGELIAATLSGPDTYYEYRGERLGLYYLLCDRFAAEVGVTLRIHLCRDSAELRTALLHGDAEIVITPLPPNDESLHYCGAVDEESDCQWAVSPQGEDLAAALDQWYSREGWALQAKGPMALRITDRLSSPFGGWGGNCPNACSPRDGRRPSPSNRYALPTQTSPRIPHLVTPPTPPGALSPWDDLFKKHASTAGVDWRLLVAQCRQESGFNPTACSWAGACGLMQLMPQTAASLGVPRDKIFDPETNVAAAARLMAKLSSQYSYIRSFDERICFMLASYNCGSGHIADAQALARKDGASAERWADVEHYLSLLSEPEYYNDPVVRHGYVRSSETVGYVRAISQYYSQYSGGRGFAGGSASSEHRRAVKNHRFK